MMAELIHSLEGTDRKCHWTELGGLEKWWVTDTSDR